MCGQAGCASGGVGARQEVSRHRLQRRHIHHAAGQNLVRHVSYVMSNLIDPELLAIHMFVY